MNNNWKGILLGGYTVYGSGRISGFISFFLLFSFLLFLKKRKIQVTYAHFLLSPIWFFFKFRASKAHWKVDG